MLTDYGLRPEVIVTPNTFIATSLVILKEGATPVYADIDPRTFNIGPKEVEKKVTNRTNNLCCQIRRSNGRHGSIMGYEI